MAKANLAYLRTAVDTAIAEQIANPLAPADVAAAAKKGATLRIAGVEAIDPSIIEDARAKRLADLKAYQADEQALAKKLTDAGITYRAIWPTRAWNEICAQQPLNTVRPNDDGTIRVSTAWLEGIEREATAKLHELPLYVLSAGFLVGTLGGVAVLGTGLYAILGSLLAGASVGFVSSQIAEGNSFREGEPTSGALRIAERRLIKQKLKGDAEAIWKMLLPTHQEPATGVNVGIDLPPAPEDIQANLVKAKRAGFDLTLHAEAGAMLLREDAPDAFIAAREPTYKAQDAKIDAKKRERKRLEALRRDPIVTTSLGKATAIIAQYGEFPLEKRVIDTVLSSEALI